MEVDRLFPLGTRPSLEQLKAARYLRALIDESLRLYPPVPSNGREAKANAILPRGGGADGQAPIFVAQGTIVAWSVYTLHRHPDFYGDDAQEFRPQRWMGNEAIKPSLEYIPFHGGPRICLGRKTANAAHSPCCRLIG